METVVSQVFSVPPRLILTESDYYDVLPISKENFRRASIASLLTGNDLKRHPRYWRYSIAAFTGFGVGEFAETLHFRYEELRTLEGIDAALEQLEGYQIPVSRSPEIGSLTLKDLLHKGTRPCVSDLVLKCFHQNGVCLFLPSAQQQTCCDMVLRLVVVQMEYRSRRRFSDDLESEQDVWVFAPERKVFLLLLIPKRLGELGNDVIVVLIGGDVFVVVDLETVLLSVGLEGGVVELGHKLRVSVPLELLPSFIPTIGSLVLTGLEVGIGPNSVHCASEVMILFASVMQMKATFQSRTGNRRFTKPVLCQLS